jgi:hypothetical protein
LFPILFVAVYVGRRQWVRAAAAVGLGAFLWLPALASEIREYPTEVGGALSLLVWSPVLYVVLVALAVAAAWHRSSWALASVAVLIASGVRFIPYQLGYLLCAHPLPEPATAKDRVAVPRLREPASGSSRAASRG